MAKTLNGRVMQKHDTEENWNKATDFVPKAGEIIIYDADTTHKTPRIKVGDDATYVNNLPFLMDYTTVSTVSNPVTLSVNNANSIINVSNGGVNLIINNSVMSNTVIPGTYYTVTAPINRALGKLKVNFTVNNPSIYVKPDRCLLSKWSTTLTTSNGTNTHSNTTTSKYFDVNLPEDKLDSGAYKYNSGIVCLKITLLTNSILLVEPSIFLV
jgi:hypothetical protein